MRNRAILAAILVLAIFSTCKVYASGYLGVVLQPLTRDLKESMGIDKELRGVLIADVDEDSPAEEAGLKKGDVIIEIDNKPVERVRDAIRTIREHKEGDRVKIKVMRESTPLTVEAVLGEAEDVDLIEVRDLARKFRQTSPRAYLGVRVEPITRSLGDYFGVKEGEGVLVVEVIEDTPAKKAGLEPGDVILEIDGKQVSDPQTLRRIIRKYEHGESVEVKYKRKNRIRTVEVKLESDLARFGCDRFRHGHWQPAPEPPTFEDILRYLMRKEYEIDRYPADELMYRMSIDEMRQEIEDLREEIEDLREIIEDLKE